MQNYREIMTSQTFLFLVGKEKVQSRVHIETFAKRSKPLSALVHGGMVESNEGCAHLDDVDPETFAQFVEYLYTNNYTASKPDIDSDALPMDREDEHGEDGDVYEDKERDITMQSFQIQSFAPTKKEKKREKKAFGQKFGQIGWPSEPDVEINKRSILWEEFLQFTKGVRNLIDSIANQTPQDDYTEVFLCHARLYVLGEKYDIQALKDLSLFKLAVTLKHFTLFPERTRDILELLDYSYHNTPNRGQTQDRLRALCILYVACEVENFTHDDTFNSILDGSNEISSDLLTVVVRRLE